MDFTPKESYYFSKKSDMEQTFSILSNLADSGCVNIT